MEFKEGPIDGVVVKDLNFYHDSRGWLTELFREDELMEGFSPAMGYISLTYSGITRGPHEHKEQADYFCFFGKFELYLWDNRKNSPTYMNMKKIKAEGKVILIPPGVVHAYKNISDRDGLVINFPDKLYKGWNREEEVDEIRYEDDPDSPFKVE